MQRKVFQQYLRSLASFGLTDLPKCDRQVAEAIRSSCKDSGNSATGQGLSQPTVRSGASDDADSQESVLLPKASRLQVLDDQVRACQQCTDLANSRTQTVFGVGDVNARLCFFGEAPGADEDRLGEPFVGEAGQLLNRILTACHIQRSEVYILNTIKCRPTNNRNPTEAECQNCRPFWEKQIEIIQPDFICCLGGVAAKTLLGTELSVGRLREKIHRYQKSKVMVTYHPAYLLRNPDAKRLVWNDMKYLMREMGQPVD